MLLRLRLLQRAEVTSEAIIGILVVLHSGPGVDADAMDDTSPAGQSCAPKLGAYSDDGRGRRSVVARVFELLFARLLKAIDENGDNCNSGVSGKCMQLVSQYQSTSIRRVPPPLQCCTHLDSRRKNCQR